MNLSLLASTFFLRMSGVVFFFLSPAWAQSDLTVNSFAMFTGNHTVLFEKGLSNRLGYSVAAKYEDDRTGIFRELIHPPNLEYDRTYGGRAGLAWFSRSKSQGWFGAAEMSLGYNQVRFKPREGSSHDSVAQSGWEIAPGIRAGYKWVGFRHLVVSPSVGFTYKFSSTDYSKLKGESLEDFPDLYPPFEVGPGVLEEQHNGIGLTGALGIGYRF